MIVNSHVLLEIAHYFAGASYVTLIAMFSMRGEILPGYKLALRLGLVSSLQATMLLGLSINSCLLSRLFSWAPLDALGSKYSYPQYVLQFLALAWWTAANGDQYVDIWYFVVLLSSAIVSHIAISKLMASPRAWGMAKCAWPVAVAAYCVLQPTLGFGWSMSDSHTGLSVASQLQWSEPPPSWWADAPLQFSFAPELGVEFPPGGDTGVRWINPTIFPIDATRTMILARGHKLTSTMRVINGVNLLTHVWESTTGVRYPPIHFVYRSLIVRSVLKLRVQASASTPFSQKVISVVSVNMHLLSARLSKDHSCSTTVTSTSDTNVRELLVITANTIAPATFKSLTCVVSFFFNVAM
jgi:hypothetical protein